MLLPFFETPKTMESKLEIQINNFLDNKEKSTEDIIAAAHCLLRVNGNRRLYLSILRRPEKLCSKLEYELSKAMKIRNDKTQFEEAKKILKKVMPATQKIVEENTPKPTEEGKESPMSSTGKREDHDKLPEDIQGIYTQQLKIIQQMRELHTRIAIMDETKSAKSSEMFEMAKQLSDLDKHYIQNWKIYDEYIIKDPEEENEAKEDEAPIQEGDLNKEIQTARVYISRARKSLSKLEDEKLAEKLAKVQIRVNLLMDNHVEMEQETMEDLAKYGVKF